MNCKRVRWNKFVVQLINRIIEMKKERFLCAIVYVLGALIVLIPIVGSLFRGGIANDSAYYICHAQLCSQGYVPYFDFNDGYTPLWTFLAAGLKLLFYVPDGNYVFYLVLHYVFTIGVAFFIFKIAEIWEIKKIVSFCGACLFILMAHWLDGNVVLLEMPSLFFGMLSVWLVLRYNHKNYWNYVWIGGLTACSFLCKQFGIGFLILNLYLVIFENRHAWRESLCLLLGFALPIALCFAFWGERFMPIMFSGYGTKSAAAVGLDVSLKSKLNSIFGNLGYFIYMVCPAVVVSLLFIPTFIRQHVFFKMLFCYFGIMGFALQFYFTSGGFHYMLYMLPFAVLLMMQILNVRNYKWLRYIGFGVVLYVSIVSLYKTYYNRVYKLYVMKNVRQEQMKLSDKVGQSLSEGSMWVVHGGLCYLYLTTGALPPNLSTIGYAFGPLGLDENKALAQAKAADNVVRYSADYPYEAFFTDSVKHFVEKHQAVPFQDSAVLVYDMHKLIDSTK